ncbi:MAG: PAS domain S-box protein [Nitrospirae bacterium]|nr:PAS domain S-box protein [Nitrospirota bacterium]
MSTRTIDPAAAPQNTQFVSISTVALFETISAIAAATVFSLGIFVLAAWMFNIGNMEIFHFNPIAMKPNAALMLVLTGLSLWFLQTKRVNSRTRFISKACALIIALIGSLTLVEYIFNLDIGIDQAMFDDLPNLLMTTHAGRMAPVTAVTFVLTGSALFMIDLKTRKGFLPSQFIAIVWGLISLISFMGYIYDITMLYGKSSVTAMAIHTSLALVLSSMGVLFVRPGNGIMAFFVQDGLGSIMARRILAAVTLTPLLTDIIIIAGQRAGLYDVTHTEALHTMIVTGIIVGIVLRMSLTLNKIDYKQRESEAETKSVASFPDENPYPVIRIDGKLDVLYMNRSSKPLFTSLGFHKNGDSLTADEKWLSLIASSLDSGHVTGVDIPVDGRVFLFTIAPMQNKQYVNLYGFDITERKLAEKALIYEKNKLQNILDSMQEGIFIVNQDFTIEYANPVVVREFGSYEDIKCYSYFYGTKDSCPWCKYEEVFQGKTVRWELTMPQTGKTYDIIDTPIGNQDGSISKLEMFRDITDRKKMENDLRLFSQAIEETIDTVHIVDMSGKIIYANKAAAKLTGYSTGESIGMDVVKIAADKDFSANVIIPAIYYRGSWEGEVLCEKKDGTLFTGWLAASRVNDNDGKPVAMIGTLRDITSRKEIEQAYRLAEVNMRALMNSITESVCLVDTNGILLTVNDTFARRFNRESREVIGTNLTDILTPDVCEARREYFEEVISTGLPVNFEDVRDGINFSTNMYPVLDDNNKVSGIAIYASDITVRKKYENYLLDSIREKEMLMREVHHRVKNNLQIVAGLIGLQLNHVTDETYKAMFTETRNRIKSIALVHDKLYRSKGLAEVDFKKYISELSIELFSSFGVDKKCIALAIDMENIIIGVDIAVPCGLIINELFTNILKYAFPDRMIGEIIISVHANNEGKFEMVISDNGVGFPENVDFRNTKSMGLHIVNILVKQIGGTIELDKTNGSKFTINFENQSK